MNNRILVIDDEDFICKALSRDLKRENFDVVSVANGKNGLDALRKDDFNLVLTDLSMADMDGIQVLKEAKIIDPDLCVIILTGNGDMNSAIDALRLGADDFLLKPYNTEELVMRIKRCLKNQELTLKVKVYEDFLPVCCVCSRIRNDKGTEIGKGEWQQFEQYLHNEMNVCASHTYCPKCYKQAMLDLQKNLSE